jgi:hypothetical protein
MLRDADQSDEMLSAATTALKSICDDELHFNKEMDQLTLELISTSLAGKSVPQQDISDVEDQDLNEYNSDKEDEETKDEDEDEDEVDDDSELSFHSVRVIRNWWSQAGLKVHSLTRENNIIIPLLVCFFLLFFFFFR